MPHLIDASAQPVEVMLWDCDGVLQFRRRDFWLDLDEAGGDGFTARVFEAEKPALRGEESLAAALERAVAGQRAATGGPTPDVPELLTIWEQVELDPAAVELIQDVRRAGIPCLLATNQQDHRVRHMREVMGYDDLVDGSFYSSEMGVMKPDPAFFARILRDLGLPGPSVGFVDDLEENVEAARSLGLRAVRHDPTTGAEGLARALAPVLPGIIGSPSDPPGGESPTGAWTVGLSEDVASDPP